MPKLELERNTWIEDASIDYAKGGFWNGAYMVTLTFSGRSCPDREFLSRVLQAIGKARLPNRKIVRLTGLFSSTDSELGILVKMLHDYGYMVQVVLSDIPSLQWLPLVSWIVYQSVKPLVPMAFSELWYSPPEVESIPEPVLPKPLVDRLTMQPIGQYLYLKRANSVAAVTKFICESSRDWQLL